MSQSFKLQVVRNNAPIGTAPALISFFEGHSYTHTYNFDDVFTDTDSTTTYSYTSSIGFATIT